MKEEIKKFIVDQTILMWWKELGAFCDNPSFKIVFGTSLSSPLCVKIRIAQSEVCYAKLGKVSRKRVNEHIQVIEDLFKKRLGFNTTLIRVKYDVINPMEYKHYQTEMLFRFLDFNTVEELGVLCRVRGWI